MQVHSRIIYYVLINHTCFHKIIYFHINISFITRSLRLDQTLKIANQNYILAESVSYLNGGRSDFYIHDRDVIILDDGICNCDNKDQASLMSSSQTSRIHI